MLTQLTIKQVGMDTLGVIQRLNQAVFNEERVINRYDRPELIMLLALVAEEPVGFKVGYALNRDVYYSAKGGVLAAFRRQGVARVMLYQLMERARARGYRRFVYDTFPNRDPGMVILGLNEGFKVVEADYNRTFQDYRIRLEKQL